MKKEKIASLFNTATQLIQSDELKRDGIGTLSEKTLHRILKHTYEPNEKNHEVKIGKFVADIKNESGVIEIQSAGFNTMRKKLDFFLNADISENDLINANSKISIPEVQIVYPIAHIKHIAWINSETGEVSSSRKSPKKGKIYDCFYELYKIKQFLLNPKLKLSIVLVDVTDYRNLNGWSADKKRGSTRYERIPQGIVDVIEINSLEDYKMFIPSELKDTFTTKDYKTETKLNLKQAQTAVNVLCYLGVIEKIGKEGRLFLYKRK